MNHILEQFSSPKLLGIHIYSNLTWQDQYNIYKKISQTIGFLKRIRNYVNIDILKMIHNSILWPHGCVNWGRYPNHVNVDRICKLQKWVAWFILRCKIQHISSNETFKTMNWMPFQDTVSYKRCLMMFKVKNNLVPSYMQK